MSFRDANYYSVLKLRNLLNIHGLRTSGTKEELLARLNKYGLLGKRKSMVCKSRGTRNYNAPTIIATENEGAARMTSFPSTAVNNEVAGRDRELDLLRRENALIERDLELTRRELDVTRRELALQRNMQCSTAMARFKQQRGFN